MLQERTSLGYPFWRHGAVMALGAVLALTTSGCGEVIEGGDKTSPEGEAGGADAAAPPAPVEPVVLSNDCPANYQLDILNRETSDDSGEVLLVGIYEPPVALGAFSVEVDYPGPATLILTSYRATNWVVTAAEGTVIEKVIANAYESPTVMAPAGTPVEISSFEADRDYWGAPNSLPVEPDAQAEIERRAGAPLTFFAGCYRMGKLSIGAAQP